MEGVWRLELVHIGAKSYVENRQRQDFMDDFSLITHTQTRRLTSKNQQVGRKKKQPAKMGLQVNIEKTEEVMNTTDQYQRKTFTLDHFSHLSRRQHRFNYMGGVSVRIRKAIHRPRLIDLKSIWKSITIKEQDSNFKHRCQVISSRWFRDLEFHQKHFEH
uniref:Uncharacterized protein n=1 Tax=Trichobilharzia regenti TaxID=157069 RepID=A0AA85K4T6_TRIRE|nr:unnamed protein product [Trichobilharzia regenti]